MYRTVSGATTWSRSGPGSDGSEGVLRISYNSDITGVLPSDCLISYPRPLSELSNPSSEMDSVYSTAPADWAGIQTKMTK